MVLFLLIKPFSLQNPDTSFIGIFFTTILQTPHLKKTILKAFKQNYILILLLCLKIYPSFALLSFWR